MPARDIRLELLTSQGNAMFPYEEGTMQLNSGKAVILPFHLELGR